MQNRSWPVVLLAIQTVETSHRADEPVWADVIARRILAEHPDCGLSVHELRALVGDIVIQRRWVLAA